MLTIGGWVITVAFFVELVRLYWHGVREQNHLAHYAGMLLLSNEGREKLKKDFEKWLSESAATTPIDLSTAAMITIQRSARQIAARGGPLDFNAMVWNRKKELEVAHD